MTRLKARNLMPGDFSTFKKAARMLSAVQRRFSISTGYCESLSWAPSGAMSRSKVMSLRKLSAGIMAPWMVSGLPTFSAST